MTADSTLAPSPTVEQVEEELGMGAGAWDTLEPQSIIEAVVRLAARRAQAAPQGPALVQQMLEVMESATSFTSKKARDEHPNVVAAARKWLAAHGITGAPNGKDGA